MSKSVPFQLSAANFNTQSKRRPGVMCSRMKSLIHPMCSILKTCSSFKLAPSNWPHKAKDVSTLCLATSVPEKNVPTRTVLAPRCWRASQVLPRAANVVSFQLGVLSVVRHQKQVLKVAKSN